jgi:multidrug efflux pump subunit AcrA (membrane-fusion protein)
MYKNIHSILFLLLLITACKHKEEKSDDEEDVSKSDIRTPVTVTTVSSVTLTDSVMLNATSTYTQDNIVKSNINGYIKAVNIKPGQFVTGGKLLFTLKTKEAESLGNTINVLDPNFHFTGIINVHAPQSGYVTCLNHQVGDYVQDGEQLAVLSDTRSFGFIMNVPFEYRTSVNVGKGVQLTLPDGSFLNGRVASILPSVDSSTQSEQVVIKVGTSRPLPENLVAKVKVVKGEKSNVTSLPKEAVLADESQQNFWVMKMIDSVTAVKTPVIKGMETSKWVEIISPPLHPADKILVTGNYGLPDTAKVKVMKTAQ